MKIDIDKLSEEELIDLNHKIVERLKFIEQARAHATMLKFSIGDRVSFKPAGGPAVYGVVTKYNRKTVTVITEDGRRWNVSPGFLECAQPSDEKAAHGKVVPMKKDGH